MKEGRVMIGMRMVVRGVLFGALFAGSSGVVVGQDEAPSYDFIADGSRISLEDQSLSIIPPDGWEIHTEHPNLTLLMQVPYSEDLPYQRTIQIAKFSEPRYIDEVTAREYEGVITRKFSEASASVEGYRIRNHMMVEMTDGREGILFYSEFSLDGVALMQAHILVSSSDRHFLLTFTDVAEHFEDDEANRYLTEAWDAMISVELAGRTPTRFESMYLLGIGVGVLVVLALIVWGFRHWRAGRSYRGYMASGSGDDEDESGISELTHMTQEVSLVTGIDDVVSDDDEYDDGDEDDDDVSQAKSKVKGKTAQTDDPDMDFSAIEHQTGGPATAPKRDSTPVSRSSFGTEIDLTGDDESDDEVWVV